MTDQHGDQQSTGGTEDPAVTLDRIFNEVVDSVSDILGGDAGRFLKALRDLDNDGVPDAPDPMSTHSDVQGLMLMLSSGTRDQWLRIAEVFERASAQIQEQGVAHVNPFLNQVLREGAEHLRQEAASQAG